MVETINIYCDESCHLENDKESIMLFSCTYCTKDKVREISEKIREIKSRHKIWKYSEIKWTKVSPSKESFYNELIYFFINEPSLKFRTIIIDDKTKLNHNTFNQTHNIWYYKMIYFLSDYLLKEDDNYNYNIYIDKKEDSYQAKIEHINTLNILKTRTICDVKMQNISSHQSEIMQLNDFIQGAVSFYNRGFLDKQGHSTIKSNIIKILINNLNISLDKTNYNDKFNILYWRAQ